MSRREIQAGRKRRAQGILPAQENPEWRVFVPFMPGRQGGDKERAFFAIFSTMIGAVAITRLLPDRTMREKVRSF
jgi:hypothetical protein